MLNNERFVANAPEDVLAKNRGLLADAQAKQVKVLEQLNSLRS
jgi:valyl-tRNA synthetase